jgi:O-antigen/teichoic acid export membrane protein
MEPDRGTSSPHDAPGGEGTAVRVGRGAALIALAKAVFMLTGAVVNLGLASVLIPRDYGDYGVTIRWVSLLNMMVVQGLLQGVSRVVAGAPGAAGTLRAQAMGTVSAVAASAAVLLLAAAHPLAGLLGDTHLAPLFMLAATITFSYAFYAALVGVVNGLQRFKTQALLDMGFSSTKMVFILAGAALGLGAAGAVGGFGLAAAVMLVVAAWATRGLGRDAPPEPLTWRALLAFSGWVMGYQAGLNLLMFVDLGLVRRAVSLGTLSPESAGHYAGAVNLSQLPYFACTAITFVVFPVLGKAAAQGDRAAQAAAVKQALRYALVLITPLCATLLASGRGVLTAIFPASYLAAEDALRVLALSYVTAAVVSVLCTVLNALGHPSWSALATGSGAVVALVAGAVWVERWGMPGAAAGSLLGMAWAALVAAWKLHRLGGVAWPWRTVTRCLAALGLVVGAGMVWPWPEAMGRVAGLASAALTAVVALGLLVPLGELGRVDLDLLLQVLGRRRKTTG